MWKNINSYRNGNVNGFKVNKVLNSSTFIEFTIPENNEENNSTTVVSLNIYDLLGNLVSKVVNEDKCPGTHRCKFDAAGMSNGIYLCELKVDDQTSVRQIVLRKSK